MRACVGVCIQSPAIPWRQASECVHLCVCVQASECVHLCVCVYPAPSSTVAPSIRGLILGFASMAESMRVIEALKGDGAAETGPLR